MPCVCETLYASKIGTSNCENTQQISSLFVGFTFQDNRLYCFYKDIREKNTKCGKYVKVDCLPDTV